MKELNIWAVQITYWQKETSAHPQGGFQSNKTVYVVCETLEEAVAIATENTENAMGTESVARLNNLNAELYLAV